MTDASVRREQEQNVVERYRADEVEQKPRLEIANCDAARLKNHFVADFISDYS